jgi:hypothetical protein
MPRQSASYEIEVVNWDKWQPKSGAKQDTWLRLSNTIFSDPDFLQLSPSMSLLWLYTLCLCSQRMLNRCSIVPRLMPITCHMKAQSVPGALYVFAELGWIRILNAPSSRARVLTNQPTNQPTNIPPSEVSNDTAEPIPPPVTEPPRKAASASALSSARKPSLDQGVVRKVVAWYCDEYRAKYKHNPKITPKRAGIFQRLVRDHGEDGARRLISGFLQLPDASLVKAAHPIEWLEQRLNEVTRFIETGKVVFREQAREADKEASLKQKHAALDRDYESRVGAVFAQDQAALPEAKREPLKGS